MDYNLYYKCEGEGNPVILLHGFGADIHSWNLIKTNLIKERKVYSIDLLGHGQSPKPKDGNYSLHNQARLVNNFILDHDLKDVTLIGHSMGGAISLILAVNYKKTTANRIEKIVLIDSPAYEQDFPFFIDILRMPILNKISVNILPASTQTSMVLKEVFFDNSKISEEIHNYYTKNLQKPGAKNALIKTAKSIIPYNSDELAESYKELSVPIFIIWGENDTIVSIDIGKRLNRDLINSKLEIIKECGHAPQEEKPEEVTKIFNRILN